MDKAPDAFRTISEVADDLDIPQHVLRFWESRFTQIKPMKRGGGRRYYRPDDVALLRGIRHLLYGQGYTIRGVQRILREQGVRFVQTVWEAGAEQPQRTPEDEGEAAVADVSLPEEEEPRGLFGIRRSREVEPPEHERPTGARFERREPTLGHPSEPAVKPEPAAASPRAPARDLAGEDVAKLQGALDELAECRRLLDAALEETA